MDDELLRHTREYQINILIMALEAKRDKLKQMRAEQAKT